MKVESIKSVLLIVMVILVGYLGGNNYKLSSELDSIKDTMMDCDAQVSEYENQIDRLQKIVYVMNKGASKQQAIEVVDSSEFYDLDVK